MLSSKFYSIMSSIVEVFKSGRYSTEYEGKVWSKLIPELIARLCKYASEHDVVTVCVYLKLLLEFPLSSILISLPCYNNV